MEKPEAAKESPEKTQLVDAGEVLLQLTAAYTKGQLTQFQGGRFPVLQLGIRLKAKSTIYIK